MDEIIIGSQVWANKNLNIANFKNGDSIFEAKTNEDWVKANLDGIPAFCFYNNDPIYGEVYGRLYNWFAVNDGRGLAPNGWEIPNSDDWEILFQFLGGESIAGGKMKVIGSEFWRTMNDSSTNSSKFSALPGGERSEYGKFDFVNEYGRWWSKDDYNEQMAYSLKLNSFYPAAYFGTGKKHYGLSVRCIKH